MKKVAFILSVFMFSFMSLHAQQDAGGVINALKSGDAEQVAAYFDKMLDLKFPDKEEIKNIGKNQAGIALKSFYGSNNIRGFELSSQREMDGTMYVVGKLTNMAEGYKISIMLKVRDGKPQIITVRIIN